MQVCEAKEAGVGATLNAHGEEATLLGWFWSGRHKSMFFISLELPFGELADMRARGVTVVRPPASPFQVEQVLWGHWRVKKGGKLVADVRVGIKQRRGEEAETLGPWVRDGYVATFPGGEERHFARFSDCLDYLTRRGRRSRGKNTSRLR